MHIETPGIQTSVLYWPAKVWKNPFKEYIVVIGYLIEITVFCHTVSHRLWGVVPDQDNGDHQSKLPESLESIFLDFG